MSVLIAGCFGRNHGAGVGVGGGAGDGASAAPQADAGASAAGASGAEAGVVGDTPRCVPGQQAACACMEGITGVQVCSDDGTFFPCQCALPAGSPPPTGGASGTAGAAGTAAGAGVAGVAGTAGAASSAGTAGVAGSAGAAGMPAPDGGIPDGGIPCSAACTNSCFPIGTLACCTAAGVCGWTWAPGAYCF